mgnify:FL=1
MHNDPDTGRTEPSLEQLSGRILPYFPARRIREYYESMGVSVPEGGISPVQEWNRDSRPLTFLDASVVAEAFLHHEERLVDKGACISFRGKKFETRPALIGCTVGIAYDPWCRKS